MKRVLRITAAILLIASAAIAQEVAEEVDREVLVQTSTIDALLDGVYDGTQTYAELCRSGDFGIGTFNALDGEMIAFDGTVWQIRADGKAYEVDQGTTMTPFAAVTFFDPDYTIEVPAGSNFEALSKLLDTLAPSENFFYAIRLDGTFTYMKTRSVPAQTKPYPPLVEVTKHQPVFEFENTEGTIVGFRCPAFAKGVNVVGDHLHFLDKAHTGGGHILDFTVRQATVSVDLTPTFKLLLPVDNPDFAGTDLSIDREKDLHEAEQDK